MRIDTATIYSRVSHVLTFICSVRHGESDELLTKHTSTELHMSRTDVQKPNIKAVCEGKAAKRVENR